MIRSNKPLQYDKRNASKIGVVQLEIPQVVRNLKDKTYTMTIDDYLIDSYVQDGEEIERKTLLNSKVMTMPYAQANALTDLCDSMFEIEEEKTERRDKYTVLGLLLVTKQDPIYGSNAEDWELV